MKVVFISTMLPTGHYSQYLTNALAGNEGLSLIVYADKNLMNLTIVNCGQVRALWSRDLRYPFQIIQAIARDKPRVVHLQYEINMYGGIASAIEFPLLLFLLRIMMRDTVVTIHAFVERKLINNDFVYMFRGRSRMVKPIMIKVFFAYSFKLIASFSNKIIVHTDMMKDILCDEYKIQRNKVEVIPIGIPEKNSSKGSKENYFFYFGYIVRRKGLDFVIDGFKKFVSKKEYENHTLVLAGGAIKGQEDAYEEIRKSIVEQGLQNKIIFKGFVDESDLKDLYSKALAVVIPARISMGSSGPLFHAISFGKCAIASNVGYLREEITDKIDGLLVENDKWENGFRFVVDNPEIISTIEDNVRMKANQRSSKNVAEAHIKVYEEISQI